MSTDTTFYLVLKQLVVPLGVPPEGLPARAAKRLGINAADVLQVEILRRATDARRRRGKPVQVYHLRVKLPVRVRRHIRKAHIAGVEIEPATKTASLSLTDPSPTPDAVRPVVVGAGPAGLFAALRLARAGWKPVIIERGDNLDERRNRVADFWRRGILDEESNVLFGMGGAGLFSDGKLNTRHKNRQGMAAILAAMIQAGAPESIAYEASPHVGTDLLGDVVANVAREIEDFGGEFRFRTRLTAFHMEQGTLRAIRLASPHGDETLETDRCLLAVGHSARDVYDMLLDAGAPLEAKPFAIGFRAEMPQEAINASQRGNAAPADSHAAAFRLSRAPTENARACYTFCMCPGGQVIACASEPGRLAVNGMSRHARAGDWGNAAFLAPVTAEDFLPYAQPGREALAGVDFQRYWEEKAFVAGLSGGDYAVPCCRLLDFTSESSPILPPLRGVERAVPANLHSLVPPEIARTLVDAVPAMLRRMRAVKPDEVTLYATETRTSSPVRVLRDANGETPFCQGLFAAGEGSGFAGGIMTSALDGWNLAGSIMRLARR